MGNVVNLRRARKERDRKAAKQAAAEARALHGRTKTEKLQTGAEAERLRRTLEQSRRDKAK